MQWLIDNWHVVIIVGTVLANVINSIVKHYGDTSPGLRKALLLMLDLVSVLTNSDSPGTVKAPLTASKRPEEKQ